MKKLSIIIPVFNEKNTIIELLRRVEGAQTPGYAKEVIIVDDCSTDGTRTILETLEDRYTVIMKEKNEGKGATVRMGFKYATGDITIIQDADLEYNPNEYGELIAPIEAGLADVVFGSRFTNSKPHRILYFWHYVGNRFLTFLSNLATNLNLTDMETCYKVFDRQALETIRDRITAQRFGLEPELVALVAKHRFRVFEVGISYCGRTYDEGKKINWKDGLAAIFHIIKFNFFR